MPDNQIQVTYIDHMGSDLSVVNAARVSFGKKSDWNYKPDEDTGYAGTLTQRDAKLIQYLAKHKHLSPFGHAFVSFHVKAPLFVHAQLVKHKFLRVNTISRRYVDDNVEFYVPDVWRGRSADKKQGSSDTEVKVLGVGSGGGQVRPLPKLSHSSGSVRQSTGVAYAHVLELYQEILDSGIAPEMARMILPQALMTEWYWSGSLDAFASMCQLRCKPDTQYETRLVADQISKKMLDLFPVSWQALINEEGESQ